MSADATKALLHSGRRVEALAGMCHQLCQLTRTLVEGIRAMLDELPPEARESIDALANQAEQQLDEAIAAMDAAVEGLPEAELVRAVRTEEPR